MIKNSANVFADYQIAVHFKFVDCIRIFLDMEQINSVGMITSSVMVGGVWWT